MVYWRGTKRITSTKIKRSLKFNGAKKKKEKKIKKLKSKDEFLLMLMRLRLRLLNEDLTDRFCISPPIAQICSKRGYKFLAKPLKS